LQITEGFAFGYAPLCFYFDQEHHSLNPSALEYPQLLSQNQVQECCINTNISVVKVVPIEQEILFGNQMMRLLLSDLSASSKTIQRKFE
jgi:hypothetical protein